MYKVFSSVKGSLFGIGMFHTDRDSEFGNALTDDLPDSFETGRSLRIKGCPYDNAAAESTFKTIKAEFVSGRRFDTLDQLQPEPADDVHWMNNIRLHGTLGYLSPAEPKITYTFCFLSDLGLRILRFVQPAYVSAALGGKTERLERWEDKGTAPACIYPPTGIK